MIILGTNSIKDTGFDVANSLRFNRADSDNLTRSTGTATNNDKATVSFWLKRSGSNSQGIIAEDTNGSNKFAFILNSNQKIELFQETSGSTDFSVITTRVFRDFSAWYHIVIAYDSSQGTASNRIKVYVNGVQETAFDTGTYPSSNVDFRFNKNSITQQIGSYENTAHMEGYLSEFVFIDGQQLAPDQFGEFDSDSNIWKPIDVSGLTFGNNGFYLDFENSGALGNDAAGSNNFTVNNLTAIDQSTDTCTNNFATLNPLNANIGATVPTLSEGNLRTSNSITNKMQTQYSTIAPSTGKFYCEVKATAGSVFRIGISSYNSNQAQGSSDNQNRPGQFSEGWGYDKTGTIYKTESSIATYTAYNTGDIICIALDMTNKKLYFRRDNNAWENSANLATGSNGIDISSIPSGTGMAFGAGLEAGSVGAAYADFNFGSPPYAISSGNTDGNGYGNFEYAVPSGYFALNTKNLAEYG